MSDNSDLYWEMERSSWVREDWELEQTGFEAWGLRKREEMRMRIRFILWQLYDCDTISHRDLRGRSSFRGRK